MTSTRKAKAPKELIKAASIATAIDKQTGKVLGFSVKSNSSSQYYQIQMMDISGERVFFCDCDAHLWGCEECCHIKAVKAVLVAKAELMQTQGEEAVAEAEKIVTTQPVVTEQGVTEVATTTPAVDVPIFPDAKAVEVKRAPAFAAPTFTNRENYALSSNQAFSYLR
jgi:hypothetical protein